MRAYGSRRRHWLRLGRRRRSWLRLLGPRAGAALTRLTLTADTRSDIPVGAATAIAVWADAPVPCSVTDPIPIRYRV